MYSSKRTLFRETTPSLSERAWKLRLGSNSGQPLNEILLTLDKVTALDIMRQITGHLTWPMKVFSVLQENCVLRRFGSNPNMHMLYFTSSVFFKKRKCHIVKKKKKVFTLLGKPNWFLKNDRCFLKGILLRNGYKPNHPNAYGQEGISLCFIFALGTRFIITDLWKNWCRNSINSLLFLIPAFCFVKTEIQKIKHQC